MKVCVTNGLQPVMLESGYQGIWTPQLVPEIGYCEYNCTLCGEVCPTGAIPRLGINKKRKFKIGVAEINENICIPYAGTEQCIVCEEHCPTPDKAIKTEEVIVDGKRILRPRVDKKLCIGCGICQNKCPVSPVRAIVVS
jgi:Pyruvate/2-oxoacid:ferredoxin oxidoreductase delta subunit